MGICRVGRFCLTAILAIGVILPTALAAGQKPPPAGKTKSFRKAPSFQLTDLKGQKVRLEDYNGKVILLDFWATWCPPCQESVPDFIELYREYQSKGFVVIGIVVGDSREAVEAFARKKGMNYPVLFGDEAILQAYPGIYFLPTAFLIDRQGFIRDKLIGYQSKEQVEWKILPLLEEPLT